ncbi:CheR family methyltransferase [Sulfuricurvum sp.]|uniref:CheR family methyltransferase n=1 Tax=Sulfuricurvum sp. TaxID=2025608 RepID=UPI0026054CA3|nr:CheR family methyltransferase [Sulfuricurvum sp.]MDD2780734.1 protein-glutamate O-methyltransferase CheR [Sulfuricurvum sp.]
MFGWFKSKSVPDHNETVAPVEEFSDPSRIYEYFSDLTGIHFDQKKSIVTPKISRFAKECGCYTFDALYEKLHSDLCCKEALINLLTVNETYFYREMGQIEFLGHSLKEEKRNRRILCAPGSSGEEPYSIAIYLAEIGCDLSKIEIVSIDINTEVISKAKKGIYPERSLYRLQPELRERYFTPSDNGFKVVDSIKRCVIFQSCNLFEPEFLNIGVFEVIFSRNMLIYFDYETILRAIEQLKKVASSEETLFFFGHADIVTKISMLKEHYQDGIKFYTP